ncbi:MAG: hypothetical protein JG774_961 [Desulfomicrobiaceae bacterium]|nr:hypothetical protein [Desulfomicrobiaceae bacterium]
MWRLSLMVSTTCLNPLESGHALRDDMVGDYRPQEVGVLIPSNRVMHSEGNQRFIPKGR